VATVVKADILVQACLDFQALQEYQAILESVDIPDLVCLAILVFLAIQEYQVIQAHLDTQALAGIQAHQAIPASADTQVRLAFLAILEQADILEPVATAANLAIQAYLVLVDILALWALAARKGTGVLFGTPQHKLLL
jgi:hypothetical protein